MHQANFIGLWQQITVFVRGILFCTLFHYILDTSPIYVSNLVFYGENAGRPKARSMMVIPYTRGSSTLCSLIISFPLLNPLAQNMKPYKKTASPFMDYMAFGNLWFQFLGMWVTFKGKWTMKRFQIIALSFSWCCAFIRSLNGYFFFLSFS